MSEEHTPEKAKQEAQILAQRFVAVGNRLDTTRARIQGQKDLFGHHLGRAMRGKFG